MNSAGGGQSGLDKRSSGFLLIVSEFHGLLVRLAVITFLVTHLPSLLLLEMSGDSNGLEQDHQCLCYITAPLSMSPYAQTSWMGIYM